MKNNVKNKRWTGQDADYVRQSLGRVSIEDMAFALGRSPMSVRLFILRKRLSVGPQVKRNLLIEMLKIKFRHLEDFDPSRNFYEETGIGQRRFWDLYFGRRPITGKEYTAVAAYLGVTLQEAFESRQLELFEEEK